MRQFAAILLLATCFTTNAVAQSFLEGLRENKAGQGTVTVSQSPEIDELVNSTKLVRTQPVSHSQEKDTKPNNAEKNTVANHESANKKTETNEHVERNAVTRRDTGTDSPTIDTSKKVMRGGRKVTGYRVQAYSGGNSRADRQKAESIGNAIKMRFPDLPIYVHFYSPRWICRVGNFRTYQEANEVLKEVKSMGYRQACIVKGKITVAN